MKILISGAGLGGPTVAYFLSTYGFIPTLVEKAPSLRTGGYKIDVRGVALEVLRKMGIYEAVAKSSTDMQGATVVDQMGKVLAEMSGDEFGLREGEDLEILRQTLCEILMQQIPQVEIMFNDSITALTQTSEGVHVAFEKSPPRTFDLVIGADGLHSNVRKLAFGDEAQFTKNLGLYLSVFTVPNTLNLDRWEMEYTDIAKGRMVNIWSSRGEPCARAAFGFSAPSNAPIMPGVRQEQEKLIRSIYADVEWEVPRLLQAMPNAPDFYFDSATQVYMNHLFKDRVCLLGDAGYCPSPMSGQGTSVALIGAYILAGELALAKGDYRSAFTSYEQEMRPFIKANQELGIRAAKTFRSQAEKSPMAWLQRQIMRLIPGSVIQWLVKRSGKRIARAASSITLKDYDAKMK